MQSMHILNNLLLFCFVCIQMRALSFLPPSLLIELPTADSALDTVLVEGKPKAGYVKSE